MTNSGRLHVAGGALNAARAFNSRWLSPGGKKTLPKARTVNCSWPVP
jgi:hypothetical protein